MKRSETIEKDSKGTFKDKCKAECLFPQVTLI